MMNRPRILFGSAVVVFAVVLVSASNVCAKTIRVEPGHDAIAQAMRSANYGDTIMLAPGRYNESVRLLAGITLRGASPDETVIVGQQDASITVLGRKVVVRDIEVRGSPATQYGIQSEYPVRLERCRFRDLQAGVSLASAPLSDVVFCEFQNCEIGVRAVNEASPTIWGCAFRNGTRGVVVEDGGPYIRNNLFHNLETALTLNTRHSHTMIVRNNIISDCTSAGIALNRSPLQSPFASVRNNIFSGCKTAARGSKDLLKGVTHCAMDQCEQASDPPGAMNPDSHHLVSESCELTVAEDGSITIDKPNVLNGHGMRQAHESRGTAGDIGLSDGVQQPGCQPGQSAEAPPIRFESEPYIANATCEEHQFLRLRGLRMVSQSLYQRGDTRYDGITVNIGGRQREIRFNVDRFYGESPFMQP